MGTNKTFLKAHWITELFPHWVSRSSSRLSSLCIWPNGWSSTISNSGKIIAYSSGFISICSSRTSEFSSVWTEDKGWISTSWFYSSFRSRTCRSEGGSICCIGEGVNAEATVSPYHSTSSPVPEPVNDVAYSPTAAKAKPRAYPPNRELVPVPIQIQGEQSNSR